MSNEASKTKLLCPEALQPFLNGQGIDIGCGPDPILPTVDRFDVEQGDANEISKYVSKQYDFVFASHCLEHMVDPSKTLLDWFSLVKQGGYLIVIVPDEDLYEQGMFPSIFNPDHKHTFTISKTKSWSPKSINVFELVNLLSGTLVKLELQDLGYDRRLMKHKPLITSKFLKPVFRRLLNWFPRIEGLIAAVALPLSVIDQTTLKRPALAQIYFVVKK